MNKFRAHSALTPVKNKPDPAVSAKRIDTPGEIESRSALFLVEKSGAKVEAIVEEMRRLCTLSQLDPFFSAYASYKEVIAGLLDQSNMILRKLSPSFQRPTYNVSEDIRQSHETFLTAASHLSLRIQPAYSDAVTTLVNQLPLDFEMFVHRYRKNTQVKQFLRKFEPQLLDDIAGITRDVRGMLKPIEFDFLNPMKVLEIIERLRQLGRDFEMRLMGAVREKETKLRVPMVYETEWHKTMIRLVPILSNLPMFLDSCKELAAAIPDLTNAIERLCCEIDALVPEREEKLLEATFADEPNPVDEIVERASEFLDVDVSRRGTRSSRIGSVIQAAEETVRGLRKRIEEQEEEKVHLEKKLKHDKISDRLRQIRATTDEVAKRYAMEKDTFIAGALKRLRGLLKEEMYDAEDPDPNREFNKIVQRISKELTTLRSGISDDGSKTKLVQMIRNADPEQKEEDLATCTLSELIGKLSDCIDRDRALRNEHPQNPESDGSDDTVHHKASVTEKTPPHEAQDTAIEKFEQDLMKLKKVINKHKTDFLPASKHFHKFKDIISTLKEDAAGTPLHSLLTTTVDVFDSLSTSLSSALFAPEYAGNYQIISALLESQRTANETIAQLQNAIKEKDAIISEKMELLAALSLEHQEHINT